MHWWAAHDARGINFHTGNHRVSNETEIPGGYDISYTTPSGLKTHPIAYALKAFSFAAEGQSIPVSLKSSDAQPNLTAYGVLASDNTLLLTVINKDSESSNPPVDITIASDPQYKTAEVLLLQSPNNDVALVSGATLGVLPSPATAPGTARGTSSPLKNPANSTCNFPPPQPR